MTAVVSSPPRSMGVLTRHLRRHRRSMAPCGTPPQRHPAPSVFMQRQRVRSELRAVAMLRRLLPWLPARLVGPVAELVACLETIRRVQQASPTGSATRSHYEPAYVAYALARQRVRERHRWLIEYGHALLDRSPEHNQATWKLRVRLAQMVSVDASSLAALLTSQCALDRAIASVEALRIL